MSSTDTQATVKAGIVIVLSGTVFIGLCMGALAYHSSNLLGSEPSTAQVSIDDQPEKVTVSVYDLGSYENLTITVANNSKEITSKGDYTLQKPQNQTTTLQIFGTTKDGQTVVLREETV